MHNKLLLVAIRIGAMVGALLTAAVKMLANTTFWGLTRRAWGSRTDTMPAHRAVVLIHYNSPYALRTVLVLLGGLVLALLSLAPAASARNGTHNWVWNQLNFHNASSELTVYSNPLEIYGWGTNVGWINFNPTNGGVRLYSDHMEGYAWGENIGWIRLGTCTGGSPCTHANTSASNYGINHDGAGNLSGYAWGTNIGWINFNPAHGGVRVDLATGSFSGYAWGENIGWIRFQSSGPVNTHTILVSADPPAGGTVSGGGTVSHGTTATVTATANAGYAFVHWAEGGTPVSTSATYSFAATADRTLVATFTPIGPTL
ncbi:MAG: InlB B-repeat-containing protein, partial [Caldilinea sp.]